MKHFSFLLLLMAFLSCSDKKNPQESELNIAVEKVRSFAFVNGDSARFYRDQLQKMVNTDNKLQHAFLKYADAVCYLTEGLHIKALAAFDEAIPVFEKEKNTRFAAYCYSGKGNCSKLTGDFDQAVFYFLKTAEIFQNLNDPFYLSACYSNLADTYLQKGDGISGRKYLALARTYSQPGSKTLVAVLHLEANIYGGENQIDSAFEADRIGIQLSQEKYPEMLSSFYDNMAQCFTVLKKYDSAEYYFKKCIAADSANDRMQLVADTYAHLANIYGLKQEEPKLVSAASYALRLCDSTQYVKGKYAVYEGLSSYYTSAGKLQKAAEAKDSMLSIYKRIMNAETEAKIAEYSVEFETAHKEKLIAEQKSDLRRITYVSILASIVALLLLISIIALYRNYKARRLIEVSKAIQKQKDLNMQAVFETEQAERIRIARDLHDSIGQKLSVLKMYLTAHPNDEEKTNSLLDETIRDVRNISHNMMPEELNFGLMKALKSDLDKISDAGRIEVSTDIDEASDYEKIPLSSSLNIMMIFRELLSNTVRHSEAKHMNVFISGKNNSFVLRMTDDGIPIRKDSLAASEGMGWKNIFTRVNILNGTISMENALPTGNIITINIPFA